MELKKHLIAAALFLASAVASIAQCAMCKATLETSDGSVGGGINEGILYIMPIPYILLGTIGFLVYRRVKKIRKENAEQ